MEDLADRWKKAAQKHFDLQRERIQTHLFSSARNAVASALMPIMNTAAKSKRDALLKFYILYESTLMTSFELDFPERQFDVWCATIEREALAFNLRIKPFWWTTWIGPPVRMNGLQYTTSNDWQEIRRWELKR